MVRIDMKSGRRLALTVVLGMLFSAAPSFADSDTAGKGVLQKITVHGKALEGNLEDDSADRQVFVYLPPSYERDKKRRYPVVYELHGYSLSASFWVNFLKWPERPDQAFTAGKVPEMILVAPDAQTLHNGSMYSSSVTTGDWEQFITRDLVEYIDSHYRTIPDRMSRGLAGHSMGGYGTARLGMKYPNVYSSIYMRSACCMPPRTADSPGIKEVENVKTVEQATKGGFGIRSTLSVAAAWSPNPKNPPFYVDLPTKDGVVQPHVIAQWAANAPLAMVHQYVSNLKQLRGIAIDIGRSDGGLADSTRLHEILTDYGVAHTFETYEGDHMNRITDRFETKVLPFFAKELSFKAAKK
jgi:enterochelin esterase-like enzyme